MTAPHTDSDEVPTALDQIIDLNERIRSFWHERASGWAPPKAATLLENSRLDRLVSLSHSLRYSAGVALVGAVVAFAFIRTHNQHAAESAVADEDLVAEAA